MVYFGNLRCLEAPFSPDRNGRMVKFIHYCSWGPGSSNVTNTDPENTHVFVQQVDQEVEVVDQEVEGEPARSDRPPGGRPQTWPNPLDLKHGVNNLQKFCYNSKPAKQDRKKDFEPSRVREMLAEKSIGW